MIDMDLNQLNRKNANTHNPLKTPSQLFLPHTYGITNQVADVHLQPTPLSKSYTQPPCTLQYPQQHASHTLHRCCTMALTHHNVTQASFEPHK